MDCSIKKRRIEERKRGKNRNTSTKAFPAGHTTRTLDSHSRFFWNIINIEWQKQLMPILEKSRRKYSSIKMYSAEQYITLCPDFLKWLKVESGKALEKKKSSSSLASQKH